MDYNTAKTLSLIGLIFLVIGFVIRILYLALTACQLAGFASYGGGASAIMVCLLVFAIILIVLPSITLYLAQDLHKKIGERRLQEGDKSKAIAIVILCFVGGGDIVSAIMFIIILVSWDEIINSGRSFGPPPGGYYPPPGYYPQQQGYYPRGGGGYPPPPSGGYQSYGGAPMGAPPPAYGPDYGGKRRG